MGMLIARKPAMTVARKFIQVDTAEPIKTVKTIQTMITGEHKKMVPEVVPVVPRPTITNYPMPTFNAS